MPPNSADRAPMNCLVDMVSRSTVFMSSSILDRITSSLGMFESAIFNYVSMHNRSCNSDEESLRKTLWFTVPNSQRISIKSQSLLEPKKEKGGWLLAASWPAGWAGWSVRVGTWHLVLDPVSGLINTVGTPCVCRVPLVCPPLYAVWLCVAVKKCHTPPYNKTSIDSF